MTPPRPMGSFPKPQEDVEKLFTEDKTTAPLAAMHREFPPRSNVGKEKRDFSVLVYIHTYL